MSIFREALLKHETKSESDRIPLVLTYYPYLQRQRGRVIKAPG